MDEFLSVVKSILPDIDFQDSQKLVTDGAISSLSFVMLFTAITDHYGITIPFEEITPDNFDSITAMYSLVQRLSKKQ